MQQIEPTEPTFGRTIIYSHLLAYLLIYLMSMNCDIKNSDILTVQLSFEYSWSADPENPILESTRSKSDNPPLRYRHLNFPRWQPSRHLGFDETGNSAIRSTVPENPTVEPNMKWIGRPLARYGHLKFPQYGPNERLVGRRSVGRSSIYTSSYTDLIYSSSLR